MGIIKNRKGFTLIELAITLVIIGLIIGGVITGQDLIKAAAVRAQISQIEKYQTAVNTFRGKYGQLPGDIKDPEASSFGFKTRGTSPGQGDGNGIIEGSCSGINAGVTSIPGEATVFWVDLAQSSLIDAALNKAIEIPGQAATSSVGLFLPAAKLGDSNYVSIYSAGGTNYFNVSGIYYIGCAPIANPGITVGQACNVDKKIDDGLPQSGRVTAQYANYATFGATPNLGWAGTTISGSTPYTTATSGTVNTCFDNNGGNGPQQYSLGISNGANVNCALSFQFQ